MFTFKEWTIFHFGLRYEFQTQHSRKLTQSTKLLFKSALLGCIKAIQCLNKDRKYIF